MLRARFLRRVVALAFALALLGVPAASAQTTTTAPAYPGTPTTVPPAPTSADIDLGPLEPGSVVNVSLCNFAPGAAVTLRTNGTLIGTFPANAQGCVIVRVEVLSTLVASQVGLASPLRPLAATGLAAVADQVQVRINGVTLTVGPYGTVVTTVSNGTGANGAARQVSFRFTVVKRGTVTRSGLVRTGTTVVKWAPLGLGLVGVGYLLVLATRRRRESVA